MASDECSSQGTAASVGDIPEINHHLSCTAIPHGTILLIIARSVCEKRDDLEHLVESTSPFLIANTESWLNRKVADSEVSFQGCRLSPSDRTVSQGGGVILYVKDTCSTSLIIHSSDEEGNYEGVWCRVKLCQHGYEIVGVVY